MRQPSLRRFRWITSLLCTLPLLTGCFTYDTTIRLAPDGSGTVEQELVFTGGMAGMLSLAAGEGEEEIDLCEEQSLGEGVRLVSAEPITEPERAGCRRVYAFADVNTLRLTPDPGEAMPEGMAPGGEMMETAKDPITFSYRPGSPATLVVRMPRPDSAGAGEEEEEPEETAEGGPFGEMPQDSAQRAMAFAMMRGMLSGSRFSMHLVLPGEIVETDATYAEGDRITLVELDFDTLLQDPAALERLAGAQDATPEEKRKLLEEVPGMKVETREEVTIRFR